MAQDSLEMLENLEQTTPRAEFKELFHPDAEETRRRNSVWTLAAGLHPRRSALSPLFSITRRNLTPSNSVATIAGCEWTSK
jgi:hypothetical protein